MIKYKKIKLDSFLYYVAWIIGLFRLINPKIYRAIPNSELFTAIQFILLFICILLKKYNKKQLIGFLILGFLLVISTLVSQNYDALLIFMLVVAFRKEDFNDIVRFDIKVKILLLTLNILLIMFGVIDNQFFLKNGFPRYTLGFYSPNTFPSFLCSIIIEIIYIQKKYRIRHAIIILIITCIIDIIFCSRTCEIILLLFSILMFLSENMNISKFICNRFTKYMPFILTILSFISIYLYNKGNYLFIKINNILSTRLYCASQYLKIYNVNFFGNDIIKYDNYIGYAQTIDISYINFLLQNGIISYFIIFSMIFKLLDDLIKNKKNKLVIILITFLIMGMVEKSALYVSSNVFLLLCAMIFDDKKKVSKNV